ncbi:MAG: hypothetical protein R2880_01720 [Deinococcales bacterium]
MYNKMHNKMYSTIIISALLNLMLPNLVLAQGLERAENLIASAKQELLRNDVSSLQQDVYTIIYENNVAVQELNVYQIFDYSQQRMLQRMLMPQMGGEVSLIYQDGEITMSMMGLKLPAPPEMTQGFTGAFDSSLVQGKGGIPDNYEILSYDGEQSYGSLIAEQVSISFTNSSGSPVKAKLLFSSEGHLVGNFVESSPNNGILVVYEDIQAQDGFPLSMTIATYNLDEVRATLLARTVLSNIKVNAEIDASLFE